MTEQSQTATREESISSQSTRKVRVRITDGLERVAVTEMEYSPAETTPSLVAKQLIDEMILRDGDRIEVSFFGVQS